MDFRIYLHEMKSQPFDKVFTAILIYCLPVVEILTALLLVVPKTRFKGLILSFVLMMAFTIYVSLITFHFFRQVPCSCAGVFHHMTWLQHLLFNLFFTAIAVWGVYLHNLINAQKTLASTNGQ